MLENEELIHHQIRVIAFFGPKVSFVCGVWVYIGKSVF